MSVSTAPALKKALKAAILARAFPGLDVSYGTPSRKIGKDVILLRGMVSDEEAATLGNRERNEAYILEVLVSCIRAFADDPEPITDRAFAIYEELAELLREDHSVGNVVIVAEPVGWTLSEPANNEAGWRGSEIAVEIRCKARI